jgi:hypothetical protein
LLGALVPEARHRDVGSAVLKTERGENARIERAGER